MSIVATGEPAAAPFRYPEGCRGGGELRYCNGVPVLTVGGEPEAIGEAVGVLALRPAPRMCGYPEDVLRQFSGGWLSPSLVWAGERMVRRFRPAYHRELEAMGSSSGVGRAHLVLGNTLFDLKKIVACSAVLAGPARSATGGTLAGRNLDYPSLGYAHEYGLVTVYRPAGKHAFVSVGFPGLVGCLSGMNDRGLTLAVLEVYQAPLFTRRLDPEGTPYALCIRQMLEECTTVSEARARLERMRRTTLFNLMVADRERVAVFEVTTRRVVERSAGEGVTVCTNHFCTPGLRPTVEFNVFETHDRLRTLRQAARRTARFDLTGVRDALHAVNDGEHTLQSMVFEPGPLRLHVAFGSRPATMGPFRALELL